MLIKLRIFPFWWGLELTLGFPHAQQVLYHLLHSESILKGAHSWRCVELKLAQQLRAKAALPEELSVSEDPHGGSEPSLTLVPGDLTPSSGLPRHCMYVQ